MDASTTAGACGAAAAMLAAHAGLWVLAAAAQRRVALGRPELDLLGVILWRSVIASGLAVLAGWCGVLDGRGLLAGGVLAGAAGIALGGPAALREAVAGGRVLLRELWKTERGPAFLALALLAAVALRHALNAWAFVPYTGDEAAYHLPKLVTWVQSGRLLFPEPADPRASFPGGMQLLQAWWVGFLRHDVLIEGAGVEMAAFGGAAAAAIARGCGVARGGALLAAAVALAAPAALVHATSAMNDIAAAACIAAAFALVLRPLRPSAAWIVAAAALAFGAGIKPVVALAAPGVFVAALLARPALPAGRPPRAALALAAAACAVGSLWYAHNTLRHGNPLHPVALTARQAALRVDSPESRLTAGFSPRAAAHSAARILGPRLFSINPRLTPACSDATGWGWALAFAGAPALLWALLRRPAWRAPAAGAALAFLLVLAAVEPDPFNARFVLWIPAVLGGTCAAAAVASPQPALASALLVAASLVNLFQTAIPPVFTAVPRGHWRERDTVEMFEKRFRAGGTSEERRAAARAMDGGERVLVVATGGPGAALARGDYRREVVFGMPADPVAGMRAAGAPVLHVWEAGARFEGAVAAAVARGDLVPVAPHWYRLAEAAR